MEFHDVLTLYFERSDAMQTYWNFYITVNLALLAFIATIQVARLNRRMATILTISLVAFWVVNADALAEVTKQRLTARSLLDAFSTKLREEPEKREVFATLTKVPDQDVAEKILADINPPKVWIVLVMHLIGDLFVLSVIWFFTLKRGSLEMQRFPVSPHHRLKRQTRRMTK
jgi:hypothetical protein